MLNVRKSKINTGHIAKSKVKWAVQKMQKLHKHIQWTK